VKERELKIEDLFEDLQDGVILYNLLEVLSKQSLAVLGKVKHERNKIKKIANMNVVWKYLGSTVRMVGIGPTDIVDGHRGLTLGMLWSLIVFFMGKDLGESGESLAALKRRVMDWVKKRVANYPDVDVVNFTDSFADGKAFMAILNDADPENCPYEPGQTPEETMAKAFEQAERLYGVGQILDPTDPLCCSDEKANMTYLCELMKALPQKESVPQKPQKTGLERGLDFIEENGNDLLEKLRQLCRIKPDECDKAAEKVSDFMHQAGLKNVRQITPASDAVDPSGRMAPFVVGERFGPPGGPTVLLYATYGTSEGDVEQWTSDPFEAVIEGERFTAKGAFQDKVNVVAPLHGIQAILKGAEAQDLPCTMRVLVGGTPPPQTLKGDAPISLADKLRDFLKANPGVAGNPDYIIVSEPGGAELAPERATVGIGCRGFAVMDMTIRTFQHDPQGKYDRSTASFGGPLVDPGFALATVLASLRNVQSGALEVEGMKQAPNADSCEKLAALSFGEHHLRPLTGYSPKVAIAREMYKREGSGVSNATLLEQLTLMPAVTVTHLKMGDESDMGPLSSRFSVGATATLHLCIPPGATFQAAAKALERHCCEAAPLGSEISFANVRGHDGWFTHPNSPIVDALAGSHVLAETDRQEAILSSPSFRPLPCGFAEAIPAAKTVTFGIHDGAACQSAAGESVKVDDVFSLVRTTVHLLHYIAHGAPLPKVPESGVDQKTAYSERFMTDLDKRNQVNKLRAGIRPGNPLAPVHAADPLAAAAAATPLVKVSSPTNANPLAVSGTPRASSPREFSASSRSLPTAPGGTGKSGIVTGPRPPAPVHVDAKGIIAGVLNELNELRRDPPTYAKKLEELVSCYSGTVFNSPWGAPMVTSEGDKPLLEAITVLKQSSPACPLGLVNGMVTAAQDHLKDLADNSRNGHIGSDGSKTGERLNRYGQFFALAGEVISYYQSTPAGIVAQLLISDGERTRQNRKSIISEKFKVCGISLGYHPQAETCCVITLAAGFGAKPLEHEAAVISEGGKIEEDFQRVLDSIPVPQLTDEATKAIAAGLTVQMDYKPGEVKLSITQATGSTSIMQCQWGG
jgi:acetylornithine deacetylase/succinyl-diaminopimelate desuccinylase-like protein